MNKRKNIKRILAMLMMALMMISFMPTMGVFADEVSTQTAATDGTEGSEAVLESGSTESAPAEGSSSESTPGEGEAPGSAEGSEAIPESGSTESAPAESASNEGADAEGEAPGSAEGSEAIPESGSTESEPAESASNEGADTEGETAGASDSADTKESTTADTKNIKVYVSISNENKLVEDGEGNAVGVREIELTGKSQYTLDDVLKEAHKQFYSGGESGYATSETQWGTSVSKLWGVENGGNYGYQVNGGTVSVYGPNHVVNDGDSVDAYVLMNQYPNTEAYSKFDIIRATAEVSDKVKLVLSAASYDENFNMVFSPVEGAYILINGNEVDVKTDKDGSFELDVNEVPGEYVISALKMKEDGTPAITPPASYIEILKPIDITVYINVSDGGKLVNGKDGSFMAYKDIPLEGKSKYTLDDVFKKAHEMDYEGGVEGYATSETQWGPSVSKFWGIENGGNYGYQINGGDVFVSGPGQVVNDNDVVDAYILVNNYPDTEAYAKFVYDGEKSENNVISAQSGDSVKMTLVSASYDENYNMVFNPVPKATVTIMDFNTKEQLQQVETAEDGTFEFEAKAGEWVVTALKLKGEGTDGTTAITAPVALLQVAGKEEKPPISPEDPVDDKKENETKDDGKVEEKTKESETKSGQASTSKATTGSTSKSTTSVPKTGDEQNIAIYAVIMFAAFGMTLALRKNR